MSVSYYTLGRVWVPLLVLYLAVVTTGAGWAMAVVELLGVVVLWVQLRRYRRLGARYGERAIPLPTANEVYFKWVLMMVGGVLVWMATGEILLGDPALHHFTQLVLGLCAVVTALSAQPQHWLYADDDVLVVRLVGSVPFDKLHVVIAVPTQMALQQHSGDELRLKGLLLHGGAYRRLLVYLREQLAPYPHVRIVD